MNEKAQVTQVKSIQGLIASIKASRAEHKDDFDVEFQEILLYAARYQMLSALSSALGSIIYASDIPDKLTASQESIQQFTAAYLEMLPDYLLLLEGGMEWMSRPGFENKAGRVLSQANRDLIERCVKDLQALIDSTDDDKSSKTGSEKPSSEKSGTPTGAAAKPDESTDHSAEAALMSGIRALIPT